MLSPQFMTVIFLSSMPWFGFLTLQIQVFCGTLNCCHWGFKCSTKGRTDRYYHLLSCFGQLKDNDEELYYGAVITRGKSVAQIARSPSSPLRFFWPVSDLFARPCRIDTDRQEDGDDCCYIISNTLSSHCWRPYTILTQLTQPAHPKIDHK